jgi:cyclopropane-fatty-acyl-phospholipid synthase
MSPLFEPWDFSVLDVENLRLHYAKTLEHWLARFDQAAEQVRTMFDAEFERAWRLYLAGSIAAFRVGTLQLFQVLFTRGSRNDIPWTRAHLYRDG